MESFTLGTGASIYSQKLVPAILEANHEIILVTCYWAQSKTLSGLCAALEDLAQRRQHPHEQITSTIRVRICFSSRSFLQKLFHTPSTEGYVYPPATWTTKLGLPSPQLLAAGNIDLRVKSLFFLPFSVMHPKFLIVDRQRAFLPSCNVSWEPWLEACLEVSRQLAHDDPMDDLLQFYRQVWDKDLDLSVPLQQPVETSEQDSFSRHIQAMIKSPADASTKLIDIGVPSDAVKILPSWHRRNPAFCLWPWKDPVPPQTPLNNALLELFREATTEVYIHTPNLTSAPVISAILETLAHGVDVTLVTGRSMMVWEQVLTAGTTTGWCIRRLQKRYQRLLKADQNKRAPPAQQDVDIEAQNIPPGSLKIQYFKPVAGSTREEEPVQDHIKLTIVDGEHTVLGSGNMDRASWFTSQELGILIHSTTFSATIKNTVDSIMQGRLENVFPP